jgi:hypothetical protein
MAHDMCWCSCIGGDTSFEQDDDNDHGENKKEKKVSALERIFLDAFSAMSEDLSDDDNNSEIDSQAPLDHQDDKPKKDEKRSRILKRVSQILKSKTS